MPHRQAICQLEISTIADETDPNSRRSARQQRQTETEADLRVISGLTEEIRRRVSQVCGRSRDQLTEDNRFDHEAELNEVKKTVRELKVQVEQAVDENGQLDGKLKERESELVEARCLVQKQSSALQEMAKANTRLVKERDEARGLLQQIVVLGGEGLSRLPPSRGPSSQRSRHEGRSPI
ncbi:hypothetical protein BDZ85DRAFT_321075 [Elsinoe ampelina]|uniref:GDP/GTP exchange factor Sec2 N-terminal domain-containing protein n=1 Tax=Elsinoe ampelina TaxID=302913 RepID=A0A6A6G5R1_9PEZI|nr:hypothetical protein BDZ85DRAFT_321075 [Elsinoe ampelina]